MPIAGLPAGVRIERKGGGQGNKIQTKGLGLPQRAVLPPSAIENAGGKQQNRPKRAQYPQELLRPTTRGTVEVVDAVGFGPRASGSNALGRTGGGPHEATAVAHNKTQTKRTVFQNGMLTDRKYAPELQLRPKTGLSCGAAESTPIPTPKHDFPL